MVAITERINFSFSKAEAEEPPCGGLQTIQSTEKAMFVFGNFIIALANLLDMLFTAYIWIVIARAVISWVNADPYNQVVRFLAQVTDPILYRIRRALPPMGGLDLSPMILILALAFLQSFLVPTLTKIGMNLN